MGIFSERLSDKQLNKIIIPGSHDSGASGFDRKNKVVDLPGILGSLRNIVKWLPGEGVTARWSNTQDKTITDMLNVGVRYFDLRVCQVDGIFYVYHGLRGGRLDDIFSEINNFLESHTGEIVILDLSHFVEVDNSRLISLIRNSGLSGKAVPRNVYSQKPTYRQLIGADQRCFIFFPNRQETFLLGGSDSYWADKENVQDLEVALKRQHTSRSHANIWVLQCVLTPTPKFIAKHLTSSIKSQAKKNIHPWIVSFIQQLKGQLVSQINIVMFDFVDEVLCRRIINLNFREQ